MRGASYRGEDNKLSLGMSDRPFVFHVGTTIGTVSLVRSEDREETWPRMAIDLYYTPLSPPCRSVMMTACSLGVRLNLKPINLLAGEHLTPEYIKINPQHNVPTIEDDGFRLNESRAICIYLVGRYGGRHIGEQLYPLDSKQRAIVDQRLYFDATVLFPNFRELYVGFQLPRKTQVFTQNLNAGARRDGKVCPV